MRVIRKPWLITGSAALCVAVLLSIPAAEACERPPEMDERYCDANGDLVADSPRDHAGWLTPDTLVFSYTPVEDPSVYKDVFADFMRHLAKKTGKPVEWYGANSYAGQLEAMRAGRLHVAGISTGPTVFGVNLAGYVPIAMMARNDGRYGYRLQLITHKDSGIETLSDLKGRRVAHVTPSSNSGNQAPRVLFRAMGVTPGVDYEVVYSGKHDNSIVGVAKKAYDAAPVASTVLDRMHNKGTVNKDDLRIVWQSRLFPTTSYGYAHNLHPTLQKKVRAAFLSFDWKGSGIEKEFGRKSDRFIPITYREYWGDIRRIQRSNGVNYTLSALNGLKLKKK